MITDKTKQNMLRQKQFSFCFSDIIYLAIKRFRTISIRNAFDSLFFFSSKKKFFLPFASGHFDKGLHKTFVEFLQKHLCPCYEHIFELYMCTFKNANYNIIYVSNSAAFLSRRSPLATYRFWYFYLYFL